jgi:TonB family protein
MVVTETGGPADARTVVPAGFGLDEQALKAINKYRFSPSKLGGVPVPVLIVIEVNFKI